MNVVHLSTNGASGGAGMAANRLHHGLTALDVRSRVLGAKDISVATDDPEKAAAQLAESIWSRGNRTARTNTYFTLGCFGIDVANHPAVREADIIHLHWVADMISIEGLAALAALGKPVVWTLHDQWAFTGGCHYSSGCEGYRCGCPSCPQLRTLADALPAAAFTDKTAIWGRLGKSLTLVCPSEWMARTARASAAVPSEATIHVVRNGLDLDIFHPDRRNAARSRFDLPASSMVALFIAQNLSEHRKGWPLLKAALDALICNPQNRADLVDGRLILLAIGDGDLADCPAEIRRLPTLREAASLADLYSAADVLICPSLEDNQPNTISEAMACGTPALAFSTSGLPELIEHGVTGRLLGPPAAEPLHIALATMLADARAWHAMRLACRKWALEQIDLRTQSTTMRQIYEGLLAQPKPAPTPVATGALRASLDTPRPELGGGSANGLLTSAAFAWAADHHAFSMAEQDRADRLAVIERQGDQIQELERLVHATEQDRNNWHRFHDELRLRLHVMEQDRVNRIQELERLVHATEQDRDNWHRFHDELRLRIYATEQDRDNWRRFYDDLLKTKWQPLNGSLWVRLGRLLHFVERAKS